MGPPLKNQALTFICGCFSFCRTELIRNFDFSIPAFPYLHGYFIERIFAFVGIPATHPHLDWSMFRNAHNFEGSLATADYHLIK